MEIISKFHINACNPKNNSCFDNKDVKLSEAIYTIFPMETEDAILFWGDEKIPLSYRYDISTIIDEIIEMIFAVKNKSSEKWDVVWSSNTFAGRWYFKLLGDSLEIDAQWREEFEASDYLENHSVLRIEREKFLKEWEKIIDILLVNLGECGYTCENLSDMRLLTEVNSA